MNNYVLDILKRLTTEERERILTEIEKQNAILADEIRKEIFKFEDLLFLTPQMINELMKEITPEKLGMALRGAPKALADHFLQNLSKNNQEDLLLIYNGRPMPLSEVNRAKDDIMALVNKKIDEGKFIIAPDKNDKFV